MALGEACRRERQWRTRHADDSDNSGDDEGAAQSAARMTVFDASLGLRNGLKRRGLLFCRWAPTPAARARSDSVPKFWIDRADGNALHACGLDEGRWGQWRLGPADFLEIRTSTGLTGTSSTGMD